VAIFESLRCTNVTVRRFGTSFIAANPGGLLRESQASNLKSFWHDLSQTFFGRALTWGRSNSISTDRRQRYSLARFPLSSSHLKAHSGVSNAHSSFTGYTRKRTQSGRYFVMCRAKAFRSLLSCLSKTGQRGQHNPVSDAAALEHGKVRPLPSYDSNLNPCDGTHNVAVLDP
jgi:hypothetical protein